MANEPLRQSGFVIDSSFELRHSSFRFKRLMTGPRIQLGLALAVALLWAPTATLFAGEADDQFAVAAGHYSAQRWQLAAEEFQRFLAEYPEHAKQAKATFFLGEALVQIGKFDEAHRQFAEVLARDPQGKYARQSLFRAGESAFLADQPDDARKSLARFHDEFPDDALNAYALRYLGELALRADDAATAKTYYCKSIERFPDGATADDCRLGLGQALLRLKDYRAAHEAFEGLVQEKRALTEANYWIGQVHKAQGQWENAAKAFEAATAADPDHAAIATLRYQAAECLLRAEKFSAVVEMPLGENRAADSASLAAAHRYLVALSQQGLGDHPAALATLNSMPADLSNDIASNVLLAKASSLLALNRHEEAIEPLKRYLASTTEIEPARKSRVLAQLALCYGKGKDFAQTKSALDQLIAAEPGAELTLQTMLQLAQIAATANENRLAGELYQTLASQQSMPQFAAKGLMGLARAAHGAGDQDRAAALYAEFLERYPTDAEAAAAAMARGQILELREQYDAALAMYDLVIKKHDHSAEVSTTLLRAAGLHDQLRQEAKAIELYERLTKDFADSPLVPAAMYCWAWCLRDLKRFDEANRQFEQLRRDHPKSDYWADATYRLAQSAAQAKDFDRAINLLSELVDSADTEHAGSMTVADERRTESTGAAAKVGRKVLGDMLPHALYLRAQVAVSRSKWDDAQRDLQRLMKEYSGSPLSLPAEFLRADVAYRRGEYVEAEKRFAVLSTKLTERNDRWTAMVPLRRAQVLAQQKRWPEARMLAEQIAKDYPNFDQQYEADYLIGRCYAADAKLEEARGAYQRVLRSPQAGKTETAAMAQWMIGETYFLQEQYDPAIREYLRVEVLYAYPHWQAGALLQAGKCYEQIGQWKDAGDLYARLLKHYPQTEFAGEARERIENVQSRTAARNQR